VKRGRGGLIAIKIDMEKAFDSMEWSFLFVILKKLGFHSTCINWIHIRITSPSSSMAALLVSSLQLVVFDKVIPSLHSYLF